MSMDEIMELIRKLSFSQGSYGRLYENLCEVRDNDADKWSEISAMLEAENFQSEVDVILYLEG